MLITAFDDPASGLSGMLHPGCTVLAPVPLGFGQRFADAYRSALGQVDAITGGCSVTLGGGLVPVTYDPVLDPRFFSDTPAEYAATMNNEPSEMVRLRQALARLHDVLRPRHSAPAEAAAIADELEELTDHLSKLHTNAAVGRQRLDQHTARRDAAYEELLAAERGLRAPVVSPDVAARLAEVHDEIFELEAGWSLFGALRLRGRLDELLLEEQRLLAKVGCRNWSDFCALNVAETVDDPEARYQVAKAAYELAEDELGRAAESPELASATWLDLDRRRRLLLERAKDLLGEEPGPEVIGRLRGFSGEAPSTWSVSDAVAAVRDAVGAVGGRFESPDPQLLVEHAEHLLASPALAEHLLSAAANGRPTRPVLTTDEARAEQLSWQVVRVLARHRFGAETTVPLVVSELARSLDDQSLTAVLDRLEQMSELVQVVIIDPDPRVARWLSQRQEDGVPQ